MVKHDINTIPLLTLKHLQLYTQQKIYKILFKKLTYMINSNF